MRSANCGWEGTAAGRPERGYVDVRWTGAQGLSG